MVWCVESNNALTFWSSKVSINFAIDFSDSEISHKGCVLRSFSEDLIIWLEMWGAKSDFPGSKISQLLRDFYKSIFLRTVSLIIWYCGGTMDKNLNTYQKDCLFFLMGNEYLPTYCLKKKPWRRTIWSIGYWSQSVFSLMLTGQATGETETWVLPSWLLFFQAFQVACNSYWYDKYTCLFIEIPSSASLTTPEFGMERSIVKKNMYYFWVFQYAL